MSARQALIPVFVPHSGCPHQCVFCDQRRISGAEQPGTAETLRQTVDEALARLPEAGEKTLAFYGGSFTAIPAEEQEALLAAAQVYIDRGQLRDIRLSTRPDAIDEAVLNRLHRYGVSTVELGVQSLDEEVLRLSGRGHTAADCLRAAALVKAAGFTLILQMMTGLPGDTPARSLATARGLIALRPDGVRIYPTVIVRGTPLEALWRAGGYRAHSLEEAVPLGATLLDLFAEANIPVIRLGLNPTEALSAGDAVAGAYHPALRELCEAERYLRRELALVSEADRGETVIFGVGEGKTSQALGQKRRNEAALRERYGIRAVKIREKPGQSALVTREKPCNFPGKQV